MAKKDTVTIDDLVGEAGIQTARVDKREDGLGMSLFHDWSGYIEGLRFNQKEQTLYVDMVLSKEEVETKDGEGILVSFEIPEDTKAVKLGSVLHKSTITPYDTFRKKHHYFSGEHRDIRYE